MDAAPAVSVDLIRAAFAFDAVTSSESSIFVFLLRGFPLEKCERDVPFCHAQSGVLMHWLQNFSAKNGCVAVFYRIKQAVFRYPRTFGVQ